MNYWKGEAQVRKERQSSNAARSLAGMFDEFKRAGAETPSVKRGPKRKLQLEEELLLTLMRLRLLFVVLAFRFKVSHSLVTQIFSTWVRFMSRELNWMIMWPSRGQIQLELPEAFRKIYPKVRCIIDCTEVFAETPSALDIQARSGLIINIIQQ